MDKILETQLKETNVKRQVTMVLIGFLMILMMIGIACYIGLTSMEATNQRFADVVNTNNEKTNQLQIMSTSIRERMLLVYDIIHTSDPFSIDDLAMAANARVRDFLIAREKLEGLGLTNEQMLQLDEQRHLLSTAMIILNNTITAVQEESVDRNKIDISQARKVNATVLKSLEEMLKKQQEYAQLEVTSAKKEALEALKRIIFLAALALIGSFIVLAFIIQHMRNQSEALNDVLIELKDANLLLEDRVEKRTKELLVSKTENLRMTAELDIGRHLQEVILPNTDEINIHQSLDIATLLQPADEMSGDYYDILSNGNTLYIGIGDVTGHGLESSIIMLMTQSALRTQLEMEYVRLESVLEQLNQTIYNNIQRMKSAKHLSLVLLQYIKKETMGEITICGQHETVLIIRQNGTVEEINTDKLGFPIGLVESVKMFTKTTSIELHYQDILILYTDGITEAENVDKELYGIQRLKNIVVLHRQQSVETIKEKVFEDVQSFIGKQKVYDDLTLLVIKQVA